MVWTFTKVVLFIAAIVGATLGIGYFVDTGGGIRVAIANQEFTLGPVQSVIGLALTLIGLWLLLKILSFLGAFIRFVNGDETAISRYFDRNRDRKGYQALTEGMMALASGDGAQALAQATRAEKFLRRPELTNILTAQAAELAGDSRRAGLAYRRLLADERTRFVGIRGLMKQKLQEGDTETARKLAEKAFLLRPSNQDIQDTLFELQATSGDWTGARKVLGAKARHGTLPKDVHRRRDAILALQEAKAVIDTDLPIEAREAAIAANKQSPDLIPAAVLAAHSYMAEGKPKYAVRILKKAWEVQPHPDLAAAFAALEPNETPQERLARFNQLFALRPGDEETRLIRAELNLAADDLTGARRALGDLAQTHPTTRALTIMAALERAGGADDAVVRGWLTRALSASRGPQWVCDKCQHVNEVWAPVCDNCGAFDTLSWREPPQAMAKNPTGTDLLPLVVGVRPAAGAPTTADSPSPIDLVDVEPSPEPEREPEPAKPAEAGAVYDAEFIDIDDGGKR